MRNRANEVSDRPKPVVIKLAGGALLWVGLATLVAIPPSGWGARAALLALVGFPAFAVGLLVVATAFKREILEREPVCRVVPRRTAPTFRTGYPRADAETEPILVVEGTVTNADNGYALGGVAVALYEAEGGEDQSTARGSHLASPGRRLLGGGTDLAGRFRFELHASSAPESLPRPGASLVLAIEDAAGRPWYLSDRHPHQGRHLLLDLSPPVARHTVEAPLLAQLGARVKSARVRGLGEVAQKLIYSPGPHSLFGDWDLETRHALLTEMELAFLDPDGLLRKLGAPPGFRAARQTGAVAGYQRRLEPHLDEPGVRAALEMLMAKLATFEDLTAVDWAIHPDLIEQGELSEGLGFFAAHYTTGDTGFSQGAGDLIYPELYWSDDIDLDLLNYRDYLRALWVELATNKLYSDPPLAADGKAAVQLLEQRFHQGFYTSSTEAVPALPLLSTRLKAILTAPKVGGYGFGIDANSIEAQGERPDQEYLDYLIELSGQTAEQLEITYRTRLRRRAAELSSRVAENIHTLQRLFSDGFQCKSEPLLPAKTRGWAPFFLQYDEWLGRQAPFFGENYYRFRLPLTLPLNEAHRAALESWTETGNPSTETEFIARLVALETTLHAALADHTHGQYALALDGYWEAHRLARVTLGTDEQAVRKRFQMRRDSKVTDPGDVAWLTHWTFILPIRYPASMSVVLSTWEESNHIALTSAAHYVRLFAIPACIADTALALGDYPLAVSALSPLTGFFLGLAEPAEKAGYFVGYYQDLRLHFDGDLPYTARYFSQDEEKRHFNYDSGFAARDLYGTDDDMSWREEYSHPVDTAFFRLKQAEAMLEWADGLYRSDLPASVARARELYKAVLWLHDDPPPICRKQLKLRRHAENPALTSQKARAQLNLFKIESGLNYYAFTDDYVPSLRYHPLRESADRFASLAIASQHSFLAYLKNLEEARIEEMKSEHLLRTTRLDARLAKQQVGRAVGEVALAELQVKKVQAAIAAKRKEIADKSSLFSQFTDYVGGLIQSYKNFKTVDAGLGIAPSQGAMQSSLLTGAGYQGMFGYGLFVSASYISLASMADAANGRQAQLKALISQALPAARALVRLKQTEVAMAKIQARIAKADAALAEQLLMFHQRRFLNIEFWSNMTGLMRRVMRRYIELGSRFAWLAERALAHEQRRPLDIVKLDYFPVREQGVSGADLLRLALTELEAARLEGIQTAVPVKHTFSLARDFPLQFGQLKKTARCVFRTEEEFFRHAYPGTYGYRVKAIGARVEQIGGGFPVRGALSDDGISGFSRLGTDGKLHSTVSARASDALPISEFQLQADMAIHELPAETLMPFEGKGVDSLWVIELPAVSNPQGLGPMTDILVTFDLQADYSADLHQDYASQLPDKVRRTVVVAASKYASAGLKALQGSSPTAVMEFPFQSIGLPKSEESAKVRNLFVLVAAAPLPDFSAALAIDSPQLKADFKIEQNMAASNAPPFTDSQSATAPSPLNVFVGLSVSQVFKLQVSKAATPGVDFAGILDVLIGVEYEADLV